MTTEPKREREREREYRTPRAVLDALGLHIVDGDVGSGSFLLTLPTSPGKTRTVDEIMLILGNPPFRR